MRRLVLAAVILLLVTTLATASARDQLDALYRSNMRTSLVKAWATFINPFGVDIMEDPYTYLIALIVMFFLVSEVMGHGEAIQQTGQRGTFAVLQPFMSGTALTMLLVANWLLSFIIAYRFAAELYSPEILLDFFVPLILIYFVIFDLISYFRPGFIRLRTRRAIVAVTALYAADLGLLSPLMDSIKNIMMVEGAQSPWIGGIGWTTYAVALVFMMFTKFLQRVHSSFMNSQRDYIQAQVAESRYQMYKTLGDQAFGGG